MFSDLDTFNKKTHEFFLGVGTEEEQFMKLISDALKKAGIHNTYYESKGKAHEWLTWRRSLKQFASLILN